MRRFPASLIGAVLLAALPDARAVEAATAPRPAASAPSGEVDLELVIATDTSPSIDEAEARLQRQGIATAFRSPEIIRAIQAGSLGKIAVVYFDWSSIPFNKMIADWRVIHDQATASAFADTLLRMPLTFGNGTSISGAMEIGARLIEGNTLQGTRRTIDISGDGPNNRGLTVIDARDAIVAKGITINGLPIITYEYGIGDWGIYDQQIDQYYANCVVGGRGAFSLPAKGFRDFANAVRRKLVLEISGLTPPRQWAEEARPLRIAAAPQRPQPLPLPQNRVQPRANCVSDLFFPNQF